MIDRTTDDQAEPEIAAELGKALELLYFAARRDYSIDLSHRAIRVLQMIAFADAPPRIDDVGRLLGCAASTASELVKRLENKGLVTRSRSQDDERVVRLELSADGRVALTEHTSLDPDVLAAGLGRLSAADRRALLDLAGRLAGAMMIRTR